MGEMRFPEEVNLEPPSWDPDGWGLTGTSSHEIGHNFNLGDFYPCVNTTMCVGCGVYGPTPCDDEKVREYNDYAPPPPPPSPAGCWPTDWEDRLNDMANNVCGNGIDDDCDGFTDMFDLDCQPPSPIVIDILGDGFSLSDAAGGVDFDIQNIGVGRRIAWLLPNTDDAWLALDRNANGAIDNGAELFGNFTPQPPSTEKNGFRALAEYDKPPNGGNLDRKHQRS